MTILLLGSGPRLHWVGSLLGSLHARAAAATAPEIRLVEDPPTRELLVSFSSGVIDALVLVDHGPFAAGPPTLAPAEAMRAEAQRAVLTLELARRAVRTLVLAGSDTQAWPEALAGLLAVSLPAELPGPCPAPKPGKPVAEPLFRIYLEPLFTAAGHPGPFTLAWPREAFLDGDVPGEILPATVEIAGRARILAYGPYLPLPSGQWRATAYLGFSHDIGKMPFILEADTGGAVARGFFEVTNGGIFTLPLDFQVTDPLHPVELRLISQDSALEGQAALIEVKLEQGA